MIRRLFNLAAAISLLVFLLSVTIAIWATLHNDVHAVARGGMLVTVGRNAGNLFITTMPWPQDEPLVIVTPPMTRYGLATGMRGHQYWCMSRYGGIGYITPDTLDPWKRPAPTIPVPVKFTMVNTWRLVVLSVVPPLTLGLWRILRRKQKFRGFDVQPVERAG